MDREQRDNNSQIGPVLSFLQFSYKLSLILLKKIYIGQS